MNELKNSILDQDITLIITSPSTRIFTIISLLNILSIEDNYKTHLFNINISSNYYMQKLINFLSGINTRLIRKYQYPYATLSKGNKENINRDKYIEAIEVIQKSNIIMHNNNLNNITSDILIIDDFKALTNILQSNEKDTISYLQKLPNKHTVLVMNIKTINENIISKYKGQVSNLVLIEGLRSKNNKEVNIRIIREV